MTSDSKTLIPCPCIRNCCLDDNDVCLGCFRNIDEITGWNASSDEEKQSILERCDLRRVRHDALYK
jgi:predicted Fe-S protein YdhL (DUF1289 family)